MEEECNHILGHQHGVYESWLVYANDEPYEDAPLVTSYPDIRFNLCPLCGKRVDEILEEKPVKFMVVPASDAEMIKNESYEPDEDTPPLDDAKMVNGQLGNFIGVRVHRG